MNRKPGGDERTINFETFNGRGAVRDGLLAVQRPDGRGAEQAARMFAELGQQFGQMADRQAVIEGDKEGAMAGLDPSFRPTGGTGLKAQAFDKAAIGVYSDRLDLKLRDETFKAYQAHKNNPKGLEQALTKIKNDMLTQDVFNEVKPGFEIAFQRQAQAYLHDVTTSAVGQSRDEARMTLVQNMESLDTEIERLSALAASPEAGKALDAAMIKKTELVTRAVKNNLVGGDWAGRSLVEMRQRALENQTIRMLLDQPAEERDAAFQKLKQDRLAGNGPVQNISDATLARIDQTLQQTARDAEINQNRKFNQWNRDATSIARRIEKNLPIPQDELNRLKLNASMLGDERVTEELQKLDDLTGVQAELRGKSLVEQRASLAAERRKIQESGASEQDKRRFDLKAKIVAESEKDLRTDPIARAELEQIIQPTPLNFATPTDFMMSLGPRIDAATSAATHYGINARYFKPDEVTALKSVLAEGGSGALDLVGAIVNGAGRNAQNVLKELSDQVPEVTTMGALVASNMPGSYQAARSMADALKLKQTGVKLAEPPETGLSIRKEIGNGLILIPSDQARIERAARLIFQARLPPGEDPKSENAGLIYEKALQEAAGQHQIGDVVYGGIQPYQAGWFSGLQKTLVPPTIRADRFRDVILAIDDTLLKALPQGGPVDADGQAYSAADLHQSVPVKVQGGYRFALGDPASDDPQYVRGADGFPFVLDFDSVEPVLRPRVPRAYLGGEE